MRIAVDAHDLSHRPCALSESLLNRGGNPGKQLREGNSLDDGRQVLAGKP